MEIIEFDKESCIITMCSGAGERVPLVRKIVTKGKSVEIWCKELEHVMVDTCRDFLYQGVKL